jgi:N-acyl-D-glutamate deacylase
MAFYNFGIRFLRRVNDSLAEGRPFLSAERAVHLLTGDLGGFFDIDAGRLRLGDRADLVVIDPAGLDASVDDYHEAPIAEFGGLRRMVNRNDGAVTATVIAGRIVYRDGEFVDGYASRWRTGRVLRAGEPKGGVDERLRVADAVEVPATA